MRLCGSAQMRGMDRYTIEVLGVPGAKLMSNAAGHIASAAMEKLALGGAAAVFCGAGNNGGDGIGAAAFLLEKGVPVRAFLIGGRDKLTADSAEMLRRFEALGGALESFGGPDDISGYVSNCGVVIDAIYGIGLNSAVRGDALAAVRMINASGAFVIAADIPSGVHADTGAILGDAVRADATITFTMAKPGHFIEPGCVCCGEVRVRYIGIPAAASGSDYAAGSAGDAAGSAGESADSDHAAGRPDAIGGAGDAAGGASSDVFAVMQGDAGLPRRRADSHKGDHGRCLIIAGSVGYTGAPALCARAASRTGAGLVYLGVPGAIYDIMAVKLDEEMPFPLPCDADGRLAAGAAGEILRRAEQCDVCLIGPGLGQSEEITELVQSLVKTLKAPIVLDADGLNAVAGNPDILEKAASPLILTPHPGEFARLGGDASAGDRLGAARDFARKHRCVLVLKGHRTITSMPDGAAYINTTGNAAMAKGGSGDVLAGMIAALIGQKLPVKDAVTTAVYLHGLAGDVCATEYGEYSVTAGDITAAIPQAVKRL